MFWENLGKPCILFEPRRFDRMHPALIYLLGELYGEQNSSHFHYNVVDWNHGGHDVGFRYESPVYADSR